MKTPPKRVTRKRAAPAAASDDQAAGENRLRQIRASRGMSQKDLAAALELDQSLLSRYERGTLRLHAGLLVRLVGILEVSADEILGIERPSAPQLMADRRFLRRLAKIDRLPRRAKESLLVTIDSLLSSSGAIGRSNSNR